MGVITYSGPTERIEIGPTERIEIGPTSSRSADV